MGNYSTEEKNDIPIRKIELSCSGKRELTPENASVTVSATVFPANATYSDISWKALNENAVEANFVKVEPDGNKAVVTALGNGEFRLVCSANNGTPYPQVLSEYEFSAAGFAELNLNPYELVYASLRTREKGDKPLNLSFQGGVFAQEGRSWLEFDNVDFGDFGSDEITLPIFHWNPKTKLEIWEGNPDEGGSLSLECEYEHESVYNTYNTNTFKLPARLRGVKNISIVTYESISLQGFVFSKPDKAFSLLKASDCSNITGDSFERNADEILNIGNNVSIEFEDMDFGPEGCRSVKICGRTRNNENAVTLLFVKEGKPERQMIAFEKAGEFTERTFRLIPVTGNCKVALVFLPGSDFDLKYIQFGK
jgi:beta-galactosidase